MEKPYHHLPDGTFRNPEGSPKRDPNVKWSYKIFNQEKKKLDMTVPKEHVVEREKVLSDLKKYQELVNQYTTSPEGQALEKLKVESTFLEEEYKKLEKLGEKYSNVSMILEAGMLNYNLLDKTFATISSSFIDPVAGLLKQVDAKISALG